MLHCVNATNESVNSINRALTVAHKNCQSPSNQCRNSKNTQSACTRRRRRNHAILICDRCVRAMRDASKTNKKTKNKTQTTFAHRCAPTRDHTRRRTIEPQIMQARACVVVDNGPQSRDLSQVGKLRARIAADVESQALSRKLGQRQRRLIALTRDKSAANNRQSPMVQGGKAFCSARKRTTTTQLLNFEKNNGLRLV